MTFQKLTFALSFLISQSLFAFSFNPPDACPEPEAFATVGVSAAEFDEETQAWVAYQPSNSFGTENLWTLIVAPIKADDAQDALNIGNNALPRLSLMYGPEEETGMWACVYVDQSSSLMAAAFTPPVLGDWKNLSHKFNLKATH